MYVSATPFKVQPDKYDEFISYALDTVVPAMREAGVGYQGGYLLKSGTDDVLSINFYETEAQATAVPTDEKVLGILQKMASLAEADFEKRKVYEVAAVASLAGS